ncbi:MAG: YfhO family protein [Bacteroidales bacterium]|nr:YfhO family protein [Bacteroidales bacterium]
MLSKLNWKDMMPYLTAIIVFIAITFAYFSPMLEGKRLNMHDINMYKGMSKELADYREHTGQEALWTNSMFGGMPAWQISVVYGGNLMRYVKQIVTLGMPFPANAVFMYFLGFYIMLLVMRVDPWLSMAGALAFGFSSYFFILIGAGHTSKAYAIGYMAPVIAGIILTYRGDYLKGGLLTAIALALEIEASHLQITYYLLLFVLVLGLFQLIDAIRFNKLAHFGKATAILVVAALMAVFTHSTNLYATWEYGKESMRGKPIIEKNAEDQTGGLDRSYVTNWSYGVGETWSLLIPNAKGGATAMLGKNNPALEHAEKPYRDFISQQNAYWGDQPGTSGPVYAGAIMVFLFILGLFVVKGKYKWIILITAIFSILLSWGKNYMAFTNLFLDYFPGYDKFRAVSMILVIAELCIPLLALLAVNNWVKNQAQFNNNRKFLFIAYGLSGGIALIMYLSPGTFFSFFSQYELQQFSQMKLQNNADASQIDLFLHQLELVRVGIFKADALRSFFFITLAAGLLYASGLNKIKAQWLTAALTVLVLIDMVPVANRYLNDSNFTQKRKVEVPFQPTAANMEIQKDSDPSFRVLDLSTSTFNDATASYFHQSLGGYHGAKLQRYQDIITAYLQPEIGELISVMREQPTLSAINDKLSKLEVINMLNTRYIIFNPNSPPIHNFYSFGNAWFVDKILWVDTPNEEIDALGNSDLMTTAVVNKEFTKLLQDFTPVMDTMASIELVTYDPNHLVYETRARAANLAVFSEIWYSKGWKAYVDGVEQPLVRVNYLLRALVIPAGNHSVEMNFEPKVWSIGEKVSLASSLLLILLVIGMGVQYFLRLKAGKEA